MTTNYQIRILYENQFRDIGWSQKEIMFSELKNEVIRQFNLFPLQKLRIQSEGKEYSDESFIDITSLNSVPLRIVPEVGTYPNNLTPKDIISEYIKINNLDPDEYEIIFKFSDNNKVISDYSPKEILSRCYIIPKVTNPPINFDNTVFENKITKRIPDQSAKEYIQAKFISIDDQPQEQIIKIKKIMQKNELSQVIDANFSQTPFRIFYKSGNKVVEIEEWKAYILSDGAEILFIVKPMNQKQSSESSAQSSSQSSYVSLQQNSSQSSAISISQINLQNSVGTTPQSSSQSSRINNIKVIPDILPKNSNFIDQLKNYIKIEHDKPVLLAELYYYKTLNLNAAIDLYRKLIDGEIKNVNEEIRNIITLAFQNIVNNNRETIEKYIKDYLKYNKGNYPEKLADFFTVDLTKIDNPLELKDNINL